MDLLSLLQSNITLFMTCCQYYRTPNTHTYTHTYSKIVIEFAFCGLHSVSFQLYPLLLGPWEKQGVRPVMLGPKPDSTHRSRLWNRACSWAQFSLNWSSFAFPYLVQGTEKTPVSFSVISCKGLVNRYHLALKLHKL